MSRIRADRYTNREGTGAPTFSDGVNVVGVTSMSGDLVVTNGTITGPSQLTISSITSSISDTAVDVFVYDTSKDSDGGAWRKRTQNTSWYNETLNTATRGSRKEFPAVAVIVATQDNVIIYDGDDPDLPMWMIFESSNTGTPYETYYLGRGSGFSGFGPDITTVAMLNATLMVGKNGSGAGNYVEASSKINFISDNNIHYHSGGTNEMNNGIIGRNGGAGGYRPNGGNAIVNPDINDVAMTVLANAPIDDTTELPVPTIAVATAGGVSVIKDDGNVVDLNVANRPYSSVDFTTDNLIFAVENPGTVNYDLLRYFQIPSADITTASSYGPSSSPALFPTNTKGNIFDSFTYGSPVGLSIIDHADGTSLATSGMIAYLTSDYNTGYMQGDIKLATLSDTNATNQTGGTVADRSVNNNSVNVTGTITRSAVATGADLVAYNNSGNENNYLKQPYNSDLDFGTGNFSVCVWFRMPDCSTTGFIVDRADASGNERFAVYTENDAIKLYTYNVSGSEISTSLASSYDNQWIHYVVNRHSSGLMEAFINGVKTTTTSPVVRNVTNTDAHMVISGRYNNVSANQHQGDITLLRISGSTPSPEQVKKIYEDEKVLFQENAKATLYGSSDAVTALAYDDTTNILHVGTSAGRSEFQGLRRINNTTVGITSAISASNELVAEQ